RGAAWIEGRSVSRSKLEAALAQALAWTPGMTQPVEEYRFDWCCNHHRDAHYDDPAVGPCCSECPTRWLHFYHRGRNWRLDFAWPEHRVAVEVEGGTRTGGRHVRPRGFEKDVEKYNELAQRG